MERHGVHSDKVECLGVEETMLHLEKVLCKPLVPEPHLLLGRVWYLSLPSSQGREEGGGEGEVGGAGEREVMVLEMVEMWGREGGGSLQEEGLEGEGVGEGATFYSWLD